MSHKKNVEQIFLPAQRKYFLNFAESNQLWIVITLFRLAQNQAEFHLVIKTIEKCHLIHIKDLLTPKSTQNKQDIFPVHTEESFQNLIESNRNQFVFTIFRLIWIQTDVRLVTNQPENGKYNLISVGFNKISKRLLCLLSNISYLFCVLFSFALFGANISYDFFWPSKNFPSGFNTEWKIRLVTDQSEKCNFNTYKIDLIQKNSQNILSVRAEKLVLHFYYATLKMYCFCIVRLQETMIYFLGL